MTYASDIIRFLHRFGASGVEEVTLLSVIMIGILLLGTSKLLNIIDMTKRIGNLKKLPIQLF